MSPAIATRKGNEYRFHGTTPAHCFNVVRQNAGRSERCDVAERQHHRGEEDEEQDQRLEPKPPGNIGAHHQESQHCAKRHRNQCHARAEQQRGAECDGEILVGENEMVGIEAGLHP